MYLIITLRQYLALYLKVRPGARYFASLELLKNAKLINRKVFTKSGLMVGLGETKDEVLQVMDDLISADVDFFNNWSIFTTFGKASSFR